jgi:hypothetical protein
MPARSVGLTTDPQKSINPQSAAAAVNGAGVDLAGADAALVLIYTGAFTGAGQAAKIQESSDNSTFTDVADADLIGVTGNTTGFALTANSVAKVDYVGTKRYLRVRLDVSGTTCLLSAVVLRERLRHTPGQAV